MKNESLGLLLFCVYLCLPPAITAFITISKGLGVIFLSAISLVLSYLFMIVAHLISERFVDIREIETKIKGAKIFMIVSTSGEFIAVLVPCLIAYFIP